MADEVGTVGPSQNESLGAQTLALVDSDRVAAHGPSIVEDVDRQLDRLGQPAARGNRVWMEATSLSVATWSEAKIIWASSWPP